MKVTERKRHGPQEGRLARENYEDKMIATLRDK